MKKKSEIPEEEQDSVEELQPEPAAEPEIEVPVMPIGGQAPLADAVAMSSRIETLEAELETARDQHLRLRAEFDNYRKRTARDMEQNRKTATADLLKTLLPVLDNLDRALAHAGDAPSAFADGVRMVFTQFDTALKARGLEAIPAKGVLFDPNVHEALTQAPSEEVPSGHVLDEYERGYKLGDTLLRPAKVIVSAGPATPAIPSDQSDRSDRSDRSDAPQANN